MLVARYLGAQDAQNTEKTVHTSIVVAAVGGVVMIFVGILFARPLLELMGTPLDVIDHAVLYMRIYFVGMPAFMIYNFGSAILRAAGDTRRPLYFLSVAGAINIVFNLIFVIVFHLGVAGVALATTISQCISALLILRCLKGLDGMCRLRRSLLKIDREKLAEMLRIGLPAGIQGIVFSLSNVLIQSSVNSFGSTVMAGNTAGSNIEGFVYTAMNAIYQTALSFTSQNMGAGNIQRIRSILLQCLMVVTGIGLVLGIGAYLLGEPLLSIYSSDPEVIRWGLVRLSLVCAPYFLCGCMDVCCGSIRGMGYSVMPMLVSLTQAENLTRFQQRLPEALEHTGGCVTALCVRQFPFLIEIFGRDKAEQLLCQMKKTADQLLKKDEFFCRDTEDRFYLFLAETDQETLRPRLQQLMDQICAQAEISAMNYQLALYCGVAISEASDHPAEMANTLMVRVQFALDKAIGGHSNTIWFFDTELHKLEELENYIESHMHQALHSGEFRMFLQPKHRLSDGKLLGAEALVRWLPRDRGPIFPDQFIPLFEKNGFCVQLDLYMVEQACRKLREWMDRGMTPVPLSVNQSKLLFFEADYVGKLTRIVDRYQISPQWITLEILEGMALENADVLNRKIADLHQAGFQISLDDFGSGYSSLNTLGKLEIDELKLDREFLLSASSPKQNRVRLIMEQIVQLAHQLTIRTVVEGVETEEDERFIRSIGCDIGQGYLYSRTVSAEEFDRLLEQAYSGSSADPSSGSNR